MLVKITKRTVQVTFIVFWIFHLIILYKTSFHLTQSWAWNFIAYFTPLYLLIEVCILFILLGKKKYRTMLIPIVILFLSTENLQDTFQYNQAEQTPIDSSSIKVLSFNTSLIPNHVAYNDSTYLDTILKNEFFRILEKNSPDILCLQEFHHKDIDDLDVLNQLRLDYGYNYYFMSPVFVARFNGYSGPIIFSKLPIINTYYIQFKEGKNDVNRLVSVDVLRDKDTIRVVNVHLKSMSIRITEKSKNKFINTARNITNIYNRLEEGFITQKSQLKETYNFFKNSPHPVVLCGDFNSLPYSYKYQFLKQHLNNTFNEKGNGFGFTLNRFPYLARIDNIFVSEGIKIYSHNVLSDYKKSDHFPILVEIGTHQN